MCCFVLIRFGLSWIVIVIDIVVAFRFGAVCFLCGSVLRVARSAPLALDVVLFRWRCRGNRLQCIASVSFLVASWLSLGCALVIFYI